MDSLIQITFINRHLYTPIECLSMHLLDAQMLERFVKIVAKRCRLTIAMMIIFSIVPSPLIWKNAQKISSKSIEMNLIKQNTLGTKTKNGINKMMKATNMQSNFFVLLVDSSAGCIQSHVITRRFVSNGFILISISIDFRAY